MDKTFYQFKQISNEEATLDIYGNLTEWAWEKKDTSCSQFANKLKEIKGNLTVKINSPGGSVSTGLGIFNELKNYSKGTVTTMVTGFAASAASLVFLAGDKRVMPKASLMFIHNAQSYAGGDANEMRKAAEMLDKVTQPSVDIYKATSNLDEVTIKQMMDEETWLTADECLKYGFATEVVEINDDQQVTQSLNYSILNLVNKNKGYRQEVINYQNQITDLKQQVEKLKTPVDPWHQFFKGGN